MHIFGKGVGARVRDGGERSQLFDKRGEGDKDFQQTVASDACRASRARRTRGALRCDLATVLLNFSADNIKNVQFKKSNTKVLF